jgi:peptide-methionine (S)-S-oxide reductase
MSVGYSRSPLATPAASTGTTGHAESVRVVFDPAQVSYGQLLQVYFAVATDPTELNRQGPDSGTQYRSALFTTTPAQSQTAQTYIRQLTAAHAFGAPIVTQVVPFTTFYPAESYHQQYLDQHPDNLYIVINDAPKVAALEKGFPKLYGPASVASR